MSHVHSGFRHELVWMPRTSLRGHAIATVVGAILAAVVVLGLGL